MKPSSLSLCLFLFAVVSPSLRGQDKGAFEPMDVFCVEFASDPQISPNGQRIVYVRNFMDIKKDRRRSNLWIINVDGSEHRPVTSGDGNERVPLNAFRRHGSFHLAAIESPGCGLECSTPFGVMDRFTRPSIAACPRAS